tara:strand:- start:418 stop:933 length:516 start_codon:yes stop_codon:yes gene_type:complete
MKQTQKTQRKTVLDLARNAAKGPLDQRDNCFKETRAAVVDALKRRRKEGTLTDECDFIAGAAAAMQAVDINQFNADPDKLNVLPPHWFLSMMRNESIIDKKPIDCKVLIEIHEGGYEEIHVSHYNIKTHVFNWQNWRKECEEFGEDSETEQDMKERRDRLKSEISRQNWNR